MTTTTEARVQFSGTEVISPRLRTTARRSVFWIVVAVILILLALVAIASVGLSPSTSRLSATNPGSTGAEALINVLRNDGVTVNAPRTLAAATTDVNRAPRSTTVVLYDPTAILSLTQLEKLKALAANIVIIQPTTPMLDVFAPGVSVAGDVESATAKADCDYRPVQRAGTVSGLQKGYRITTPSAAEQGCLAQGSVYSLVRVTGASQTVTVLGSTTLLTNGSIDRNGNAALALGLFGETPHLVWYRPSFADTPGVTQDGVLPTPPWVFLAIVLVGFVVIAAGVWRGRRLGPVVVERMPVSVRASETLEGRARLYQRASARRHALDALRIGTISRLAVLCGLPTLSTVDEVIGTVASVTGHDAGSLRSLLLDDVPRNDAQLVHLSDELRRLEAVVREAVVRA